MWKFKFGLWAVVLITSVFSFSACGDDDDNDTFVPPANIEVALKQLYPGAQNIEWEVKGVYYVADCWVTGDELEVWFDVNANWVMTENELDNVNQLVPAVYTAFMDSDYNTWVVGCVCFDLSFEPDYLCHSSKTGQPALFTLFLTGRRIAP